jgi:hypothetical protein
MSTGFPLVMERHYRHPMCECCERLGSETIAVHNRYIGHYLVQTSGVDDRFPANAIVLKRSLETEPQSKSAESSGAKCHSEGSRPTQVPQAGLLARIGDKQGTHLTSIRFHRKSVGVPVR